MRNHSARWMVLTAAMLVFVWGVPTVKASQASVFVADTPQALLDGDFEDAGLLDDGSVGVSQALKALAPTSGAVLSIARGADGAVYAGTANPGRIYRISGSRAELIFESQQPMVVSVEMLSNQKLVALLAPDPAAVVIDTVSKKAEVFLVPTTWKVKLLLQGVVVGSKLYAVGGGDEGVLLSFDAAAAAKDAWRKVVTVQEPLLRSIAKDPLRPDKAAFYVGGSEKGIVYEVEGERVRALLDAVPSEITAIVAMKNGNVYAAAVDGEGKLSKTARAKNDDDKDNKDSKDKPRKVKSAELWRVTPSGGAEVVWQSSDTGVYALARDGADVIMATGPKGRVYRVVDSQRPHPRLWLRAVGHDEITAVISDDKGLAFGAAHGGGVLLAEAAQRGVYLSPVWNADVHARFGRVVFSGAGELKFSLRTGNTEEPDATWSSWYLDGQMPPKAQYVQVKVELAKTSSLHSLGLAYVPENRAPQVVRMDVLAPGWKLVSTQRDPPEARSVTLGEKPFAEFLDRRGGQNPTQDERTFAKQSFDVGYRTVYAYAEDDDKDALRYRFALGRVSKDGKTTSYDAFLPWSELPFWSFEASRLSDGLYRVKVEVDDALTSGPTRSRLAMSESPTFVVSHKVPTVEQATAVRTQTGAQLRLSVVAALPLTVVRCSTALDEWLPLDPADGVMDGAVERFDVMLQTPKQATSVSCEIYDEALNFGRVDVPIR